MRTPEEHMGDLVKAYEEARQPLTLSPYEVTVDHGVIAVLDLIRARDAEIQRHHADHLRWCTHCTGWRVPPGLARDPQERP